MKHKWEHEQIETIVDLDEDGDGTEYVNVCPTCGAQQPCEEGQADWSEEEKMDISKIADALDPCTKALTLIAEGDLCRVERNTTGEYNRGFGQGLAVCQSIARAALETAKKAREL